MCVCMFVASFETFGSGSFGGPLGGPVGFGGPLRVRWVLVVILWWCSGGPVGEGGGGEAPQGPRGAEGPPAREASVPAPQGPRRRAA